MKITKQHVAVALVLVALAASGASAFSSWIFGRTAVVQSGALQVQDGTLAPRFQAIYVVDRNNPKTCVMVLRDTDTQAFSLTAVDPGSCQ